MSSLKIFKSQFDLSNEAIKKIIGELQIVLKDRVKSAFLFGSTAAGTFNKNSDVDILLVVEKVGPNVIERSQAFADLLDVFPRMDIIVYTEDEYKRLVVGKSDFWKVASKNMKQII